MKPGPVAALALVLVVAACGVESVGGDADDEQIPSGGRPAAPTPETSGLPSPRQLPPEEPVDALTPDQVDAVVAAALRDPALTAAVAQGEVTRVLVRASREQPGSVLIGHVIFSFDEVVTPTHVPWEVLCDIGGQTSEWSGAVARVVVESGDVESSPLWLTGANCVGVTVPEDLERAAPSSPPGS